jgi:hypothetical protein
MQPTEVLWTHVLLAKEGSDVTVAQVKSRENVNDCELQALTVKERRRRIN